MGKAVDNFFKKFGDLIVSIFYLALGIALIIGGKALPASQVMEIGPDFMPIVVGAICTGLSIILLIMSVGKLRKGEEAKEEDVPEGEVTDYKRVIESLILALAYVNVLKPVGFIISTLAYLLLQIIVLSPDDKRKPKDILLILVIDVVFTFVVYFLFRYAFKIVLPAGIFSL